MKTGFLRAFGYSIVMMLSLLLLSGCASPKPGAASDAAKGTEAAEQTDEQTEKSMPLTGYLKLFSDGVEQDVYEYFSWGTRASYDENGELMGLLNADGEGFFTPITEKEAELPVIEGYCRADGLDVRLIDGARITQIVYYDTASENGVRRSFSDKTEFDRFFSESSGDCIIDVAVMFQGRYFEQYDSYENNANGYAFILRDGSMASASLEEYGSFSENAWVKVISGGRITIPFGYFVESRSPIDAGSVYEEGVPLMDFLPKIRESLPVVGRAPDFCLSIYEWSSVRSVTVYDAALNRAAVFGGEDALAGWLNEHEGEFTVDVRVSVEGCNIMDPDARQNEYGYLFRVGVPDPASTDLGHMLIHGRSDPALLEPEWIEPHEYLIGEHTAYYEDGEYKGMIWADGMSLAYFLAEKYSELPAVYGEFTLIIDGNAEVWQINVYDPQFERIAFDISLEELYRLAASHEDTLYAEVILLMNGNYIEEAGEYESRSVGYAFAMK